MKKRIISACLAILMAVFVIPVSALAAGSLSNFTKKSTYQGGQFSDVSGEWFAPYVQSSFELGLFNGTSPSTFSPGRNLTLAEALKLAACLHSIYNTGAANFAQATPWYQPYVDYALNNGIIGSPYSDYTMNATRADFAAILAKALPAEALTAMNAIEDDKIPDVKMSYSYGPAVYMLYRAGVLTGSDSAGTFFPNSYITRDAVATIVARMANPSLRKAFVLTAAAKEMTAAEVSKLCSPAVFYIEVSDSTGKAYASGSGFFISSTGVAVTNYHVIDGASSAKITTTDGKTYDVTGVYDYSKDYDLALLQIGGSNFPFLNPGDSSAVVNGETVYTIGSPKGLSNSISQGIVANAARTLDDSGVKYIQIDAAISHGSSGGALINTKGQVIGVTTLGSNSEAQNLNFAVPINLLQGLKQGTTTTLAAIAAAQPKLTITPSQTAVSVAKGSQVTITFTMSSRDFSKIAYYAEDETLFSCTWGDWSGNALPLTIKGIAAGTTIFHAALADKDKNILVETLITVTVTASSGPQLTVTPSQNAVSLAVGSTVTVMITPSSEDYASLAYHINDTAVISCSWGDRTGNSYQLKITGLAAGTTKLRIALLDSNKNVLVEGTPIDVTVTNGGSSSTTLTNYPGTNIPDWGAFTGTPLNEKDAFTLGKYVVTGYFYRASDITASANVCYDQYFSALEHAGFSYKSSFYLSGYQGYTYANSEYYVDVGLMLRNGVLCMRISLMKL